MGEELAGRLLASRELLRDVKGDEGVAMIFGYGGFKVAVVWRRIDGEQFFFVITGWIGGE